MKTQWRPWQELAKNNHLTFIPGNFFDRAQVVGNYRGYHLTLKTCRRSYNQKHQLYTQIVLSTSKPITDNLSLTNNGVLNAPMSVDRIIDLFTSDELHNSLWERVKAQPGGREISYEKPGIGTDLKYLQVLLDWLGDVADAYPAIVALGGVAVPFLRGTARRDSRLKPLSTQLLDEIAQETTTRLGEQASQLRCLYCLTRCKAHKIRLNWQKSLTYYGCRLCRQSREFCRGTKVIALLNDQTEKELVQQNGILRVNWSIWGRLFDFDEVEIIKATDEDVERFAVQAGNDTDEARQPRYKQMRCTVAPDCQLSENTMRILRRMFGRVEIRGKKTLQVTQTRPERLSSTQPDISEMDQVRSDYQPKSLNDNLNVEVINQEE